MKIQNVKLTNFRNYDNLNLEFSEFLNIIVGLNGVGKTNLVESLYTLSLTKSFRTNNDKVLIKDGAIKAKINGDILINGDSSNFEIVINSDGKETFINKTKIVKISDYISRFNLVLFNPTDTRLIDLAPSDRRRLINIEISQVYKEYLIILSNYQKILKQRNFYLRSIYLNRNNPTEYLDILTNKLVEYGKLIAKYRLDFINRINNYITDIYKAIFNSGELKVRYKSSFKDKSSDVLLKKYNDNYKKEMMVGKTIDGIHHDDLVFILDNNDLKYYGSEGQKKNAIISFKLAIVNIIKDIKGEYPILILDDLFSELDKIKANNLVKTLNKDVQTFITTTEKSKINKKLLKLSNLIEIDNGKIKE